MLYYPSKLLANQVAKGGSYLDIKRVISIVITDFVLVEKSESYHNRFTLYDPVHGVEFTDLLEVNTLELPKLPETPDGTEVWNWMRFLSAESAEDLQELLERSPHMEKPVWRVMELTDDERAWWREFYREKAELDAEARERYVRNEGRVEGRVEGLVEAQTSIARNLLERQIPIKEIAALTGLSIEEVEDLCAKC